MPITIVHCNYCCQVLELDLKLYPSNIRKLKDIKPPKQQQNKKQHGKQDKQQQQQPQSQLQRALSHPLLSQPSLRHYLQEKRSGAAAAAVSQQQQTQQQQQSSSSVPELGTVRVALWWAPTWRHHHAFDVAERVSFCLLPGELKVQAAGSIQQKAT
jgi:hypothetical protein